MASAAAPSSAPPKGKFKRDALLAYEESARALWDAASAFEADADPSAEPFLVTFPYPYMNGALHIGHAFSLTKAVFRAQFERHRGKRVLFPFGFHCTGMPIQAAANRLASELEAFGCPPAFPEEDPDERAKMEAELAAAAAAKEKSNESKAKGGKTKLTAKTGTGIVRQWNILKKMVAEEEIPKFADPLHWLTYFPPLGVKHMKRFGSGVDWRRSFITTSVNPYYDAFVRWQFNTLKKRKRILYGKRNNVYSILDGQVCADHDRSEGEGAGAQEYTLIKLRVTSDGREEGRHAKMRALTERYPGKVTLVAATLRPETMYGQTNCFVLPEGEYGAFKVDATDEVFVMSGRSARGLSCQMFDEASERFYTKEFSKIERLETFSGWELLGLPVTAPNAAYDAVYVLPLLTISMGKGTGVVTSVPSDAPDDYVALSALKDKPEFRAKYGIAADMVDPYDVVPIIHVPELGNVSAATMCEKLKIKSFNDKAKLEQAKNETYLKGFNTGVMEVGPYAGERVCDAKPKVRADMIREGTACPYFEPESKVMSRTHDECVVASTDQWYLRYSEEDWSDAVLKHISDPERFDAYDEHALGKYKYTVGWLKEWACTRQFGLGTKLPWDDEWVIESLSDSTIYMAYYAVAHVLQGKDNLEGVPEKNPRGIRPEDLTDEVFDAVFFDAPTPSDCSVPLDALEEMRSSFRYWYPMSLRVSAKDLIPNHLTMALYNHAAVWEDEPELWPKGYYTNGHVLVDAEKMSKSKGNFLMMDDTISEFTADGTRLACADAGDSMDDANFSRETADVAILALSNEMEWILETVRDASSRLRAGTADLNFMDRVLSNEVHRLARLTEASFERMQFREGLKTGWFEMMRARNEYRSWCEDSGVAMNKDVLRLYIDTVLVLICPVCPHWSETVWQKLENPGLAVHAPWPDHPPEDKLLTRQGSFLRDALKSFRSQVGKAKKGAVDATFVVSDAYPEWKARVLLFMRSEHDGGFPPDFMKRLKGWAAKHVPDKKRIKLAMQFASWIKKETEDVGPVAMDAVVPYDQKAILEGSAAYVRKQLKLAGAVRVVNLDRDGEAAKAVPDRVVQNVNPGKPYLWMH